ncbi:hypothetical protein N7451_007065 [Penicillium sp. IBT 35674x]|nr:hypothetical protein N7451_007065 [Penicillium sp. IBT 35674x]
MTGQLTWLVTGCTSGMEESLAHAILAAGDRVIATKRGRESSGIERLTSLKDAGAAVEELDVTASEEVIKAKVDEAWSIYGHVDVLVNNAGYIDVGVFEEVEWVTPDSIKIFFLASNLTPNSEASLVRSLRTNAIGPLNLTRAFLPYLRSRGTGTILFMSSVGAYYGAPGASTYSGAEALPPRLRLLVFEPSAKQEVSRGIKDLCKNGDGDQPGDPRKAADIIIEAVKGEGRCEGMALPPWLPLGADGCKRSEKIQRQSRKSVTHGRSLLLRQTSDIVHRYG